MFYDYAENGEDENLKQKIIAFLEKLGKFSEFAKLMKIKDFVSLVIDEFDLKLINNEILLTLHIYCNYASISLKNTNK